jgi:hypothetical protein
MRIAFRETEGLQQEYSYEVADTSLPLGEWELNEIPDALLGEVEGIAQSDTCPPFLWTPEGCVMVKVFKEEERPHA